MLRRLSPRASLRRLKPLDFLLLCLAGAATFLSALSVYGGEGGKLQVVVSGEGGEWIYPLDRDRSIEVEGPLGTSVVVIEGADVHIDSSPCPNQTCVASGHRARGGQWLACLPNKVFVRIEGGGEDGGVDATVF
jgi:hypothetical protein